ncbi:MAG: hypothetical protein H7A46_22920 [Verrucomicrobiales bacterium]|nr:hypothetical protein [Verrucomicrobiales bacterium]
MHAHRSFRLTGSNARDDTRRVSLLFPLVQQLLVLGMSSLILDGGRVLQVFSYAALAYWTCVAIIFMRRGRHLTSLDKIVIRVGFLMACAISVILTGFIWHLRGV